MNRGGTTINHARPHKKNPPVNSTLSSQKQR